MNCVFLQVVDFQMKNILVPVDFSGATVHAIRAAHRLATVFGGTVRLFHVAPPDPAFAHSRSWPQEVRDEMAKELKKEHDQLREIAAELEAAGIPTKSIATRGPIAETILSYAGEVHADVIVMASRKEGALSQFLPRSVIRGVLKKATCPVVVVPEAGTTTE